MQRPSWLPAYIPELQGLRGLAVLAVVLYHCHARLVGTWAYGPVLWGWAGVNLFFALSGFLITSILIEAREKPDFFRNFYARRILRIWPVYFLLLIVCYAIPDWFLGDTWAHQAQWKIILAYIFFVQNLRHEPLIEAHPGLGAVLGVAAHQLVGAFAGQHHLHALRSELRQHEDGNVGGFADWRATAKHGGLPVVHEGLGLDHQFLMVCAELLGDDAGMVELGIFRLAEADREGPHRACTVLHHGRDHGGGIDTP